MRVLLAWLACDRSEPSDRAPDAPTGETGQAPDTDTGLPPIDAPEAYGDGIDSDCDGWDALPLGDAVGVTAQLADPTWLQLGHDLDIGDIDGDGDAAHDHQKGAIDR